MERTINIDGRDVKFRSSGALPIYYRAYTGREYFADAMRIESLNADDFSTEIIENLIWVLAKAADPDGVGDKLAWYDSFESFPLFDVFVEVNGLITSTMQTVKKAKAAPKKPK